MRSCLLLALLATGCVPRSVSERLTALEARVAELERAPAPVAAAPRALDQHQARLMFDEAEGLVAAGETEAAIALFQRIATESDQSAVVRRAERSVSELSVVGQPAGPLDDVEQWLQGEASFDEGRVLVVFFEAWCPHCRREVPRLGSLVEGRDVEVVLLTNLSRSTTEDDMRTFLESNDVDFPVAKLAYDGLTKSRFAVTGVPAAAIVEDGTIVWRGHPARLAEGARETYLPLLPSGSEP